MIFNPRSRALFLTLPLLVLAGCPGKEDNTIQSGIRVQFAEVHVDENVASSASLATSAALNTTAEGDPHAHSAAMSGGYDHDNLEHHEIADVNNNIVAIYRAYLVIDGIELIACPSLAHLPRLLLNGLIGQAHAHSGHGSEPVGGRAIDKPNVIDIVTQDGYFLPLGAKSAAPGRYCGVRVALTRLASEGYGKPDFAAASSDTPTTQPETPEMSGKIFAIRADYCSQISGPSTCGERTKIDIDDRGLAEPLVREIEFDEPLALSADLDEAYVAIGIGYGGWLNGVDATKLASDDSALQKLLDNIAASLHVYEHGWGALPDNI